MRLLLLALVLVLLAGCDSADDPVSSSLLPDDAQYAWSLEQRTVETDSLTLRLSDEADVRVVARDAAVPGYRSLTEIETSMRSAPDSVKSRMWYDVADEQLREVAYRNAGAAVSAQPRGGTSFAAPSLFAQPYTVTELLRRRGGARAASTSLDSLIVREDPRVVYRLPLAVGQEWVSFTDPFGSTREVVGRETITVAAGTFDCFVVRTEIDIVAARAQFEWLDFVSPEHGLVLRTIDTVQEYRGPDNQGGLLIRFVERLERTGGA